MTEEANRNVDVSAAPAAEPVQSAAEPAVSAPEPVQVISVTDLLDRLNEEASPQAGEVIDFENAEPLLSDQFYDAWLEDTTREQTVRLLTEIRAELRDRVPIHPLLTTDFEEYSVTEGLLLSLFLCVIVKSCIKMIKGGFSWLLW